MSSERALSTAPSAEMSNFIQLKKKKRYTQSSLFSWNWQLFSSEMNDTEILSGWTETHILYGHIPWKLMRFKFDI